MNSGFLFHINLSLSLGSNIILISQILTASVWVIHYMKLHLYYTVCLHHNAGFWQGNTLSTFHNRLINNSHFVTTRNTCYLCFVFTDVERMYLTDAVGSVSVRGTNRVLLYLHDSRNNSLIETIDCFFKGSISSDYEHIGKHLCWLRETG